VLSKLFESVLEAPLLTVSNANAIRYQFGYKAGHSTGLCISAFKQTVDCYYSGVARNLHGGAEIWVWENYVNFDRNDCLCVIPS